MEENKKILNTFIEDTNDIINELKRAVDEVSKELNYKTTEDADDVIKRVEQPLNNVYDYSNKWLNKSNRKSC